MQNFSVLRMQCSFSFQLPELKQTVSKVRTQAEKNGPSSLGRRKFRITTGSCTKNKIISLAVLFNRNFENEPYLFVE